MAEVVTVPLMVTGGFRTRAAMEQALADGGASLIGLGRPMCVQTDAPARLLAGAEELPRYESDLALLPGWLNFLTRIPMIRAVNGFATQFWFYTQLDAIGKTGAPIEDLAVHKAAAFITAHEKSFLRERRAHRQS